MTKWITAILAAVTIGGATLMAATLGNLSGQSCGTSTGTWHFVNNQTGGAAAGTLTATFSDGTTCITGPAKVLGSTQHFFCTAGGTLTGASTDLPGKLVLSDFSCGGTKCDPKTDPNCK
jgi:hypothetical protein